MFLATALRGYRETSRYFLKSQYSYTLLFYPPVVLRPNAGQGLLILEVSRSH